MSNENSDASPLFEEILSSSRRPEQVARWRKAGESPTYKLLRNPVNLEELNQDGRIVAIWRENGTLTYVSPRGTSDFPDDFDRKSLSLEFKDEDFDLYIVGITNDAIAQTAAFFLEMKGPTKETSHLLVTADDDFDFRAVELQAVPSRNVQFQRLTLSAAQCIALATRPHPVQLKFKDCIFEDGGDAFVDALQNRDSSFGSLTFEREDTESIALNDDNLKGLLQVDVIENLSLPSMFEDEIAVLPFSAKVGSLAYEIWSKSTLEAAMQSLNIETTKLSLSIYAEES